MYQSYLKCEISENCAASPPSLCLPSPPPHLCFCPIPRAPISVSRFGEKNVPESPIDRVQ